MRSPLSPPNHQSSSPASQTDVTARATLPLSSVVVATTVTLPETPAFSVHPASPCASVVTEQLAPSFVTFSWLS